MDAKTILDAMIKQQINAENQNRILKKESEDYIEWLNAHNGNGVRAILANLVRVNREIRKNKHVIKQDTFTYTCKYVDNKGNTCGESITLTKKDLDRISDPTKALNGEDVLRFRMLDEGLCKECLRHEDAIDKHRMEMAEKKAELIDNIGSSSIKVEVISPNCLHLTNEKGETFEIKNDSLYCKSSGFNLKKVMPK
jgi:hypothetical protein